MGAAKGVHITEPSLAGSDALTTAKILAKAIEREGFDVVIAATESTDGSTGTVPQMVAELLGVPALTFVKHIECDGGKLTVHRQTEAGYDVIEAELPAVVSVTAGVNEPRYPSLKGIMAAKSKPVETIAAPAFESSMEVVKLEMPPERPPGKIVGKGVEAVPELVRLLKEEAKVL